MADTRTWLEWQIEIEALQDQVLIELDELNTRVERTLAELLSQRGAGDVPSDN